VGIVCILDLSLKSVNDIDCLFDKEDESRLVDTMASIGYFQGQYDPIEK